MSLSTAFDMIGSEADLSRVRGDFLNVDFSNQFKTLKLRNSITQHTLVVKVQTTN
jgi:hypothetical protein